MGVNLFCTCFRFSQWGFKLEFYQYRCNGCNDISKWQPLSYISFFSQTLDESDACSRTELIERQIFSGKDLSQPNEGTFIRKLPVYRDKVVEWMITNKPYLDPNFKLIDVMQILPLNRSYISRVFNEGFGCSFSDVVRDYRIREAERMLVSRMDIPVGQVGELCGFSSPSVFHRTFVQSHNGLTPNRYRKQAETK